MASLQAINRPNALLTPDSSAERFRTRPLPLRAQSEHESFVRGSVTDDGSPRARCKSTFLPAGLTSLSPRSSRRRVSKPSPPLAGLQHESPPTFGSAEQLSPPMTPHQTQDAMDIDQAEDLPEVLLYDFTKLDYELERTRLAGTGLWSNVFLADAATSSTTNEPLTPPWTPPSKQLQTSPPSLFAVKCPSRPDAKDVFKQEARVLTHLMRQPEANQWIITFHGLDERNSSLVFEGVIGGSLENLNGRLKQMTEVARHLELIASFSGLAEDLISGLAFLHDAGVVHADIKPGNILLDMTSDPDHVSQPVLRARYIDFSASFRPAFSADSTNNSGGTWDYMAPEQMRIQKDLNTPTHASDVWSLGITLLYVLVGDSPYAAACGGNNFMLREAIKGGDPISLARMEPKSQKRLAACQDFVDWCRLALHKDRERRITARVWKERVESSEIRF